MKKLDLATRTFPSRIADLGFSLAVPRDWIVHPLPDEAPDFDEPGNLVPLAVITAPHSAIVLAVAARPAYSDGTLSDWGRFLLERESASVRAMGEVALGVLPALFAEATKESAVGTLVLRTAFAEDGARLINVTLTAPEMLADAVLPVWHSVLQSFSLQTQRGGTVPVFPPVSASAEPAPPVEEPVGEVAEAAPQEKPRRDTKRERKKRRKELAASPSGPPAWWTSAESLQAAGRTEEAVALVGRECDVQGALLAQADLWARTMRNRLDAGDRAGAREAWQKSSDLAFAYAASATSGGEGAALSMQRDAFLAQLGPQPELEP